MNTNMMTGTSKNKKTFREIKTGERNAATNFMNYIHNLDEPRIRYKEGRPVTDIKQMLISSAELYPNHTLFMQKFDKKKPFKEITYGETLRDVNGLGTSLINLGLKGTHVGVIGANSYQWADTYLAVVGGVGVIVPLDKELSQSELQQLTKEGELSAVIATEKYAKMFQNIKNTGETQLRYIIQIDHKGDETASLLSWERLVKEGKEKVKNGDLTYVNAEVISTELAVILFTSGTTGVAKGVKLSNKNLVYTVMMTSAVIKVTDKDIFFSQLPIHHTYECTCTFLMGVYSGSAIAFNQGLKYIVKDMQEVRPTMFLSVPLVFENFYNRIIQQIRKQGREKQLMTLLRVNQRTKKIGVDISKRFTRKITDTFGGRMRLFISGGAALDHNIADFFNDIGIPMVQGYGLTECSPLVAVNPDIRKDMRNASAGFVFPYDNVKIINPDENGVGEICFKGPNIMMGYYNSPEATEEALQDGWFITGDLGYLDKDNYVYITGRKKNVIITANGENVFPEELEHYLMKSDYIEECIVWGNDDSVNDSTINAAVRLNNEAVAELLGEGFSDKAANELIQKEVDKINTELALYKKIRKVVIRKREFIKTTALKIKRFEKDNKGE